MSDFPALNWLAVVAAAVAAFALGWLWFGPLFGRKWQAEVGLSDEQMSRGTAPMVLGLAFALNLLMSTGLAAFRATNEITSLIASAGFGICVMVNFAVPVLATNHLFSQRSFAQFAIDAGYFIAMFVVMGVVQVLLGG